MALSVTKDLMNEHQFILKYIELMRAYIDAGNEGNEDKLLDKGSEFVDFIQNFADNFHHAKEEDILFKYLIAPDVLSHCNPVPQMLYEHDNGRAFTQNMQKAIQENNYTKLAENVEGYGMLLQQHIYKEDNILYPMGEQALPEERKQAILNDYITIENKLNAKAIWEKYQNKLKELEIFLAS